MLPVKWLPDVCSAAFATMPAPPKPRKVKTIFFRTLLRCAIVVVVFFVVNQKRRFTNGERCNSSLLPLQKYIHGVSKPGKQSRGRILPKSTFFHRNLNRLFKIRFIRENLF